MSIQANVTTDPFNLPRYLVLLALDRAKLDDYVEHPESREAEMIGEGLGKKEIELLSADGVVKLIEYLQMISDPGPAPPDPPPVTGG